MAPPCCLLDFSLFRPEIRSGTRFCCSCCSCCSCFRGVQKQKDAKPKWSHVPKFLLRVLSIQRMDDQSRAQFRFKPSGFGRHDNTNNCRFMYVLYTFRQLLVQKYVFYNGSKILIAFFTKKGREAQCLASRVITSRVLVNPTYG